MYMTVTYLICRTRSCQFWQNWLTSRRLFTVSVCCPVTPTHCLNPPNISSMICCLMEKPDISWSRLFPVFLTVDFISIVCIIQRTPLSIGQCICPFRPSLAALEVSTGLFTIKYECTMDLKARACLFTLVHAHSKSCLHGRAGCCVACYGTYSLQQAAAAPVHATLQTVCCQYTVQYREHLIS